MIIPVNRQPNIPPKHQSFVCPTLLLLLTTLLAACGRPDPQPLVFGVVPWQDGEVSVYRVTDVDNQVAGTARVDLALLPDGQWNLRREINTHGTQEIVVIDLRGPDLRPSQATMVRIDATGTEQVRSTYAGGQVDLELTTKQDVTTYQRAEIPSDARDQRSLLMIARALPLARGYATRLNSFLPVAGLLDRVNLWVVKQEQVTVPAGVFDAWRTRFDTGESYTDAWFGVAPPYPLVKYIDGRNGGVFELTDFQPAP